MVDESDKRSSRGCGFCSGGGFLREESSFPYRFKKCEPCAGSGRMYPNAPKEEVTAQKAKPFGAAKA